MNNKLLLLTLVLIMPKIALTQISEEDKINAQYAVINYIKMDQTAPKITIDTDRKTLNNVNEYMRTLKYSQYVTDMYYEVLKSFYDLWLRKITKDPWQHMEFQNQNCIICGNDGINEVIVTKGIPAGKDKMDVKVYYCGYKKSNNDFNLDGNDIVSKQRSNCNENIDFEGKADLTVKLRKIEGRWKINTISHDVSTRKTASASSSSSVGKKTITKETTKKTENSSKKATVFHKSLTTGDRAILSGAKCIFTAKFTGKNLEQRYYFYDNNYVIWYMGGTGLVVVKGDKKFNPLSLSQKILLTHKDVFKNNGMIFTILKEETKWSNGVTFPYKVIIPPFRGAENYTGIGLRGYSKN